VRLGLFGGTFDPPHIGHLIVAQDALEALRLDRILFIPAGAPPHKLNRTITPAAVRLEMLRAAIGDDARFAIESLELDRPGPSFTVDTAAAMAAKYPGADLFLLIGADQFREFATWREPERLAGLVSIAVLSREGAEAAPAETAGNFGAQYVNVTRIDISSTAVRRRCAAGESIRYLVPAGVEAYLSEHRVYGAQ
jgi:nicotinate-nucleotide adenylyltransferase